MLGAALMLAASGAAPASTLLTGLREYWKLDGNGDGALGAYNATLTGSATYPAGKIGAGLQKSGTSYLSASGAAPTGSFTLAFWLYPTGTERANVFGFGIWSANQMVDCIWNITTNSLGIHWFGNTAQQVLSTLTPNAWNHYALTYDGATLQPFVNGSAGSPFSKVLSVASGPVVLGGGIYAPYNGANFGIIDEAAVWSRVLTGAEISELYNGGAGKAYPF